MNQPETDRRAFLKGAAVTTAAVGAGVVAPGALADVPETLKPEKKSGYRETDHVRAYYRLARR